jgi:plasmid stability protein
MANLTITVDDEVLKRARIRAIEHGTSVNTVLSEHLARYARVFDAQEAAVGRLLSLATRGGEGGKQRARRRGRRTWKREDLYDRQGR